MDREQYLAKRQEMMAVAQDLVNVGKIEEFQAKKSEIEILDKNFEETVKAQTELDAMNAASKAVALPTQLVAGTVLDKVGAEAVDEDYTNSIDYRKAFMNHVCKGTAIPGEFMNANANTKTTDVGAVIPNTVLEKIIQKMESVGMILSRVTRTSIKGGVTVPTSTLRPVASWVAEGATSTLQKATTGTITFAYHKLRCAVSVSLEVDTMSLAVFEALIIENIATAMVKAIETAIMTGDGTGKPKGILSETAPAGQNIDIAKTSDPTYATLQKAEGALPLAYESEAVWLMTKKTFAEFLSMVDSQGQPVARVNYGIGGAAERMLNGRTVVLNDYMTSLGSTITSDTVVACLFNMKDYVLNTNFNMGIKEYYDETTEDKIKKSVMLVDGKVVDVNSLVTITKKFA